MKEEINFLTNFNKEDLKLYETMIKLYDHWGDLYIEYEAYDIFGKLLPNAYSLHGKDPNIDRGKFWAALNEMWQRKYDGKEYWMHLDNEKFPLTKR